LAKARLAWSVAPAQSSASIRASASSGVNVAPQVAWIAASSASLIGPPRHAALAMASASGRPSARRAKA
jgi:hypothetical protein